jgi:hypothetical protein
VRLSIWMEHVIAQRGGDVDPLKWVLPLRDRTYQEALLERASSPGTYSRLDGLSSSLGLVLMALDGGPHVDSTSL